MKLLVVGSGLIGAQRIQALTKLPAVSEITVFDLKVPEGTKLSAMAGAVSENAAFSKKYDAAVVATPHDTPVELLPRIFPHAPSVLVEKPHGRTTAETENLIR